MYIICNIVKPDLPEVRSSLSPRRVLHAWCIAFGLDNEGNEGSAPLTLVLMPFTFI